MFKFGKIKKTSYGHEIPVTVKNYYGKDREFSAMYDIVTQKLELVDMTEVDYDLTHVNLEDFLNMMNIEYNKQQKIKQAIKAKRKSVKLRDSWWHTLDVAHKEVLCAKLKDKLPSIVDALLEKRNDAIKASHYDALIRRSQLGTISVSHPISPDKLTRLPKYDYVTDSLFGSLHSFIALAECIYPSMRSIKKDCHIVI